MQQTFGTDPAAPFPLVIPLSRRAVPLPNRRQHITPPQPGVFFISKPITLPPGWLVALHVDHDMKAMCCVMIAPEHAGPSFIEDSWAWWEAHLADPTAASVPAFGRPLRLVPPSGPASGDPSP